jgi:hypothetical protein
MHEPASVPRTRSRLDTGLDVLAEWTSTAEESAAAAVYRALFAMTEGWLLRGYRVVDDLNRPSELFVIVTDDVVLKLRIHSFESYGIVHIEDRRAS